MRRPFTGRNAAASLCLVLLLAATSACSGNAPGTDEQASSDRSPSGVASLTSSPEIATDVRMGQVIGRLPAPKRTALQRQIGQLVDGWWEASYLGGDYPRETFAAAFPGFTPGAEARARRDKRLMSNLAIGPGVDSVTALKRRVTLDVVATDRRARSVTARFVLTFKTSGANAGVTTVRGRLFLTRRGGGWRVFGYDVSRGATA
jgi:hypothetical protein